MSLEDKYSNTTEGDDKKIIISDGDYAICEFLQELTRQVARWARNG